MKTEDWTAEGMLKVAGIASTILYLAALIGAGCMVAYTIEPWRSIGIGIVGGLVAGLVMMFIQAVASLSTFYNISMALIDALAASRKERRATKGKGSEPNELDR